MQNYGESKDFKKLRKFKFMLVKSPFVEKNSTFLVSLSGIRARKPTCERTGNLFKFFSSGFLHTTTLNYLQKGFWHVFFLILILDPKWRFCRGYSLCTMGDFQNCLISPIFRVFSSGFFAHNNSKLLVEGILICLNSNFWPKVTILQRLQPLHDGRFSKLSYFFNNCFSI